MAKWGEGDPRWIVEERPDATNVNNWHWTEKNATPWSKDRISTLFKNFQIADNDLECTIFEVEKIEGEATANNRKGKLIFFYEWNIILKWNGHLPGEKDIHEGKITIPNLSEENDIDDIEITITINENNAQSEKLKIFMYNIGRDKIRKQIQIYLNELKKEYSKGLILPKKENESNIKADNVSNITSGYKNIKNLDNIEKKSSPNPCNGTDRKFDVSTLEMKIQFQCRAKDLYDVLTKTEMITAFTHGPVKMELIKGGEFVYFGGNVHGKFEEIIPNKKIVQTWRLKQWPLGHFSRVEIKIEEKGDHTELHLVQTGVPSNEKEATKNNWKKYYWNSIKQTFGFGVFLL